MRFLADRDTYREATPLCCRHSTRISARLNAAALPPARHWQPCLTKFVELCATKCGATSATRAGQSRSRPSTESPVAGARRRCDRHARAGQRLGFHRAPAGRRDGLIQTLTRFRRRSCRQETAALRDFSPVYVRFGSSSATEAVVANVRFTSKADKKRTSIGCNALPNHLVGERE